MEVGQKISILLAEYNTLRAEVMAARSNVAQAAGIMSATLMAIFAFKYSTSMKGPPLLPWALLASAVIYFAILLTWNEMNTRGFTSRLRELEEEIDKRAGERLMLWETDYGWGGMIFKSNPKYKGYSDQWPPKTDSEIRPPQSN
jgi:hypothetical protein